MTNINVGSAARARLSNLTLLFRAGRFSEWIGEALVRNVGISESWGTVRLCTREDTCRPWTAISVQAFAHPAESFKFSFAVIDFSFVEKARRTSSKWLLIDNRDFEALSVIAPLVKLSEPVDALPALFMHYLIVRKILPWKDDLEILLKVPHLALTTDIENGMLCVPLSASRKISSVRASGVVSDRMSSINLDIRRSPRHNCLPTVLRHVKPGWNLLLKGDVGMFDIAHMITESVLHPVVREEVDVEDLNCEFFRRQQHV